MEWFSWIYIFGIPILVYWLLVIGIRQESKHEKNPSLLESMCVDAKWYDPRIYGDFKW